MVQKISNEEFEVRIDTFGAEIISINKGNKELIWQDNEKIWNGHAPVLFPVCGAFRNDEFTFNDVTYHLPKHGFAKRKEFSVRNISDNYIELYIVSDDETRAMYPFDFVFTVIYELNDKLSITYSVENKSNTDMYFAVGSHEAYNLFDNIEKYSLIFEKPEDLKECILDGSLITHEYKEYGNNLVELPLKMEYFKGGNSPVFKDIKSRKVWLNHNGDGKVLCVEFEDFKHLLIWTACDKYLCIEPWTCCPDYVDSNGKLVDKPDIISIGVNDSVSIKHLIHFIK